MTSRERVTASAVAPVPPDRRCCTSPGRCSPARDTEVARGLGRRRADHVRAAAGGDRRRPGRRLGAARAGRRALPRRARRARRRRRGHPGRAGHDRPRRRRAAAAGRRLGRRTRAGSTGATDLPVIIRAGRHIARTKRYIRNYADEIEPDELPDAVRRAGGPRRRLGEARRRLDRPRHRRPGAVLAGRRARGPRSPPRTRRAPGSPPTASARTACRTCVAAGIDGIEHATGLRDAASSRPPPRGGSPSSRPWSTSRPSPTSPTRGEEKFPRYAAHMRALHARRYETVRDGVRGRRPGLLRHRRRWLAARTASSRRRSRELVAAGLPPRRGAGRRVLGRPGAGSAGRASRRGRPRTSSSTAPTRAPTWRRWRTPRRSCCGAASVAR